MKKCPIPASTLLLTVIAAAAGPAAAANLPDTSKMNILFINIEDCNAGVFGCYGHPICKTPNIDRLAATAVRFDSAYCQAICCNPTRTSFLTGLRPLSTRVLSNGHVMNEHLPAGIPTLPEMLKDRGKSKQQFFLFMKKQPTKQQAKEAIAAYYACVSFVDDNLGMVLDALEKEGLADNTVVVFLGDHGFHLGDHGCWSKYSMLEATRRVPLIVRVPGMPANGKVCRQFVEFVDLVPTLGELVKLALPKNLEGTSFAPLLADPDRTWKKAVFMVDGDGGQMVRTGKYSYLELKKGPVRKALYDLEKDPWETVNLAEDAAHTEARQELADLLKQG